MIDNTTESQKHFLWICLNKVMSVCFYWTWSKSKDVERRPDTSPLIHSVLAQQLTAQERRSGGPEAAEVSPLNDSDFIIWHYPRATLELYRGFKLMSDTYDLSWRSSIYDSGPRWASAAWGSLVAAIAWDVRGGRDDGFTVSDTWLYFYQLFLHHPARAAAIGGHGYQFVSTETENWRQH